MNTNFQIDFSIWKRWYISKFDKIVSIETVRLFIQSQKFTQAKKKQKKYINNENNNWNN